MAEKEEKKDAVKAEKKSAEKKAEKKPAVKSETKPSKKNSGKNQNKVVKYFKDLKSEFKKVVWPSKKSVINNTAVVMAVMVLSGLGVFALDSVFAKLLSIVLEMAV